jgi:phosphoribosylaminoimidazolecarboxamide formyltransferase/IMP cyclohydrolase
VSRRALLSVFDKAGVVEFARGLHELGFELVSSGGTATAIADAGIPVTLLSDMTGVPEMLEHRVVTLHPKVHGGILADRGKQSHLDDLEEHGIEPFDLVVSNLYPFFERPEIETIDVGGPAMTRAAAKNHAWVGIVTSPDQYDGVLAELRSNDGALTDATRRELPLERTSETLRYGENPHQRAARYRVAGTSSWWDGVEQHSGLALSYLNFYDTDAAWRIVHDLGPLPAVAIIKHANPCGVAIHDDLASAYQRALECDERSAFGGIVATNRPSGCSRARRPTW